MQVIEDEQAILRKFRRIGRLISTFSLLFFVESLVLLKKKTKVEYTSTNTIIIDYNLLSKISNFLIIYILNSPSLKSTSISSNSLFPYVKLIFLEKIRN